MLAIKAIQIAEAIQLKKFRAEFSKPPQSTSSGELFYVFENNRYVSVFNYGVIVFAGYDELGQSDFVRFAKNYCDNVLEKPFAEEYNLSFAPQEKPEILNEQVVLPEHFTKNQAIKIVMLNVAQSAGLDFYEYLVDEMLTGTQAYTKQLENLGTIKVSKKNLLKFIGKMLNIKNSIVDNLYILDDPAMVWDDPDLEWLNRNLKDIFDILARFKDLDYRLKIVEDNLTLFSDLLQHRESAYLEWIVIGLILIEVLDALFGQLLKH